MMATAAVLTGNVSVLQRLNQVQYLSSRSANEQGAGRVSHPFRLPPLHPPNCKPRVWQPWQPWQPYACPGPATNWAPFFAPDQRLNTSQLHLDDVSAELAYVAQQVSRMPVAASLLPGPLVLHAIHDVCCCQIPYLGDALHAATSMCTYVDSLREFGAKMYRKRTLCRPLLCPRIAEAKTLKESLCCVACF